jgi:tetratricopeptide (TPR) repeat protein
MSDQKPPSHITEEQAKGLLRGSLIGEERSLVLSHLLTQCEECIKLVRGLAFPNYSGEEPDYSGPMRRLELGFIVHSHQVEEERSLANEQWEILKNLDSTQRLNLVKHNPDFRHWGLYERVVTEAKAVIRNDPFQSIDLTSLALLITENLDPTFYSSALRADFRAGALTAHANAKRLLGDFQGAGEALSASERLLDEGTGDPIERINLISIRSSLFTDLGQFEQADMVLYEALGLAHSIQDSYLEGRLTIQQSSNIGWTDPIRGLELADRGLALLGKGRIQMPEEKVLQLCAIHLLALWANEAGDPEEARSTFETYRYLYEGFNDAFWTGRILHLQGHIAKAEGELPQAEAIFRQLVEHYSAHSFEFDLVLASLDLSEVLALQGRALDSGENMEAFLSLLDQWQVNAEILKRWASLKDSLLIRRYKLTAFRELSMVLRRNWNRRQA